MTYEQFQDSETQDYLTSVSDADNDRAYMFHYGRATGEMLYAPTTYPEPRMDKVQALCWWEGGLKMCGHCVDCTEHFE